MPAPDSEHLLDLAVREMALETGGAPRQANLRRAGSTAYYAMFHALCASIANTFCGGNDRAWALLYRSLDHGKTKSRCSTLGSKLDKDEFTFFGRRFFGPELRRFASLFAELQATRHDCDYNPDFKARKGDMSKAISDARAAIAALEAAPIEERKEFLAYVLLGLRR